MNASLYNELKTAKDVRQFNKILKLNNMNDEFRVQRFRSCHGLRPTYGLWENLGGRNWRLLASSSYMYELAWALNARHEKSSL